MSDPSQPEKNAANEVQPEAQSSQESSPGAEELSAEELDEVSGAGLIYLTTGTTSTTVSSTPPPPPATTGTFINSPGSH